MFGPLRNVKYHKVDPELLCNWNPTSSKNPKNSTFKSIPISLISSQILSVLIKEEVNMTLSKTMKFHISTSCYFQLDIGIKIFLFTFTHHPNSFENGSWGSFLDLPFLALIVLCNPDANHKMEHASLHPLFFVLQLASRICHFITFYFVYANMTFMTSI